MGRAHLYRVRMRAHAAQPRADASDEHLLCHRRLAPQAAAELGRRAVDTVCEVAGCGGDGAAHDLPAMRGNVADAGAAPRAAIRIEIIGQPGTKTGTHEQLTSGHAAPPRRLVQRHLQPATLLPTEAGNVRHPAAAGATQVT
jgi:hypothetical protein